MNLLAKSLVLASIGTCVGQGLRISTRLIRTPQTVVVGPELAMEQVRVLVEKALVKEIVALVMVQQMMVRETPSTLKAPAKSKSSCRRTG